MWDEDGRVGEGRGEGKGGGLEGTKDVREEGSLWVGLCPWEREGGK